MRARNALERLAAAGRPLLALADSLVDTPEEDRILARIVASDRQTAVAHRWRRNALALAAAAILAAAVAVVATGILDRGSTPVAKTGGHYHVALTGPTIQLAGYHFRTPAGYASSGACEPATSTPGSPNTVIHSMRSAASTAGGCIGVAILARSWTAPPDAQAVSVGSYDGFLVPGDHEALFVRIPVAQGDHYLVVAAEGLSAAQLIAIAQSGLPASPSG